MALKLTRNRVLTGAGALASVVVVSTALFISSGPSVLEPGGDLQAAINAAQPGDTIVLQANSDYVCPGTCRLPNKAGEGTVTIKSSRYEEIGARVGREPSTQQRQMMARVRSSTAADAPGMVFEARPGSHDYALLGLDIAPPTGRATTLVQLGTHGIEQDTPDEIPMRFKVDRSWIHGAVDQEVQRGIGLNSGATEITNNWITDIHGKGYDTQAIGGYNGPGPYKIIGNYLEGAGENVMFGGADATVPDLVPSDIEFRQNEVVKPLSWYANHLSYAGIHWTVKNLFELKNARRIVIEGNIFDGNWTDAQAGRAIAFTPRPSDSGSWAVIEDVLFINNIVKNVGSGVIVLGADEPPAPTETRLKRMTIANNLWEIDGPKFGSNGAFATVINKTEDVTIEHNTVIQTNQMVVSDYAPNTRFIYRDNIARHNDFGIFGSGIGIGNVAIDHYFPGATVSGNLIVKEINAPSNVESIYPAGNHYPANMDAVGFVDRAAGNYRLSASSPYKGMGSDGKDPGCNIDTLKAALGGGVSQPLPTATTTITPASPAPTISGESPNNTRIPTATQIVDSTGNVWTRLSSGIILQNGQNTGGVGSQLTYCNRIVYAFGTDSQWYKWAGGWQAVGVSDPCGGASPSPTSAPSLTPIPSPTSTVQPLPSPSPSPVVTPKPSPSPSPTLPICAPNAIIGNPARCLCTTGVRCTGSNARCL